MYGSGLYFVIVFVSFFVAAFVFSLLINSLFLRFSKNLGMRNNQENLIRWSNSSKPALGGISFYIILLISIAATTFVFEPNERFHNVAFLGFVISATIAFLMGLFDDAFNTKVWLKLFAQVSCGVILIATGTHVQFFGIHWVDYLLTVLWVVGMMNSVNMLDNMDGITSVVSIFILLAFLILLLLAGTLASPFVIILSGLIAALLGFLFFNWNPSKLYMGDTGSQFLGFILAFAGIIYVWNFQGDGSYQPLFKRAILLAIMFVLPLSDTITVVIKRLRRRTSPFVGGKDHTTHHLSYLGLSDKMVAMVYLIIAAFSCTLFVIGCAISHWHWYHNLIFGLFFVIVFISLFIIGNKNIDKSLPKEK